MKFLLPIAFSLMTAPSLLLAGPQYVDETGFAVSGHDVVAYFGLKQNKVGETQPAPVKGNSEITAEHNGVTWAFATAENRNKFVKNPDAYAPQYNGHCAYGVAQGGKVPANPTLCASLMASCT